MSVGTVKNAPIANGRNFTIRFGTMQILAVDVGTGTQDILLYDSRLDLENAFKLVVPSPTMIVRSQLREATRQGESVVLKGVTMGGGPSHWAAEDHLKAGLPLYATPKAARSFDDDLEAVEAMGIRILSEEEADRLPASVVRLELRDFDFGSIEAAFARFGVSLDELEAVAVAVFDHGDAPPGYSDRQFRFDYLDARIQSRPRPGAQHTLSAFAYRAEEVPAIMTRLLSVVQSAQGIGVPLVIMDTAPAAVLGATFDPSVGSKRRVMVTNVGNFHTLAFRLGENGIEGVFEHHTGLIDLPKLENLLRALSSGELEHEDVFGDQGHGALIYEPEPLSLDGDGFGVAVTGPRRNMMRASGLRPYFAVPFGDMMISGCFGLLAATSDVLPELSEPIRASLRGAGGSGTPPWEVRD
jgi:uncharacterized protein (DUF1786 family)